jgi:hypothetical protein
MSGIRALLHHEIFKANQEIQKYMALSGYHGNNPREMFPHLVGETITGAFEDLSQNTVLALGSGCGLEVKGGILRKIEPKELETKIERVRGEILKNLASLRCLGSLPADYDTQKLDREMIKILRPIFEAAGLVPKPKLPEQPDFPVEIREEDGK